MEEDKQYDGEDNQYQSEYQTNESITEAYSYEYNTPPVVQATASADAVTTTKSSKRPWAIILASLAVLLLLINCVFLWQIGNPNDRQYKDLNEKIAALQVQLGNNEQGGDIYNSIYAFNAIKDSIVRIEGGSGSIFGSMQSGSGWIVSAEGYIVTCQHVIDGARDIRVILNSGHRVTASVYASDFNRDIAILKITPPSGITLKAAKLAQDLPVQGQPLLAVGYPESYNIGTEQMSVFLGVCSAIKEMNNANQNRYKYTHIQSDVAMNSGNSGGPLINMKGEVVGMVSWGYDFSMMENIGFALGCNEISSYLVSRGINI